ncbi:hypothetical protein A2U01_0031138, partial [Trifolium medium]|nr:hypothetical protein [Trifolium medium]
MHDESIPSNPQSPTHRRRALASGVHLPAGIQIIAATFSFAAVSRHRFSPPSSFTGEKMVDFHLFRVILSNEQLWWFSIIGVE